MPGTKELAGGMQCFVICFFVYGVKQQIFHFRSKFFSLPSNITLLKNEQDEIESDNKNNKRRTNKEPSEGLQPRKFLNQSV